MCVPQTSIAAGRPGIEAVHELRRPRRRTRLATAVPLPATSLARFHATMLGGCSASTTLQAHAPDRAAALVGRARRPRARRVDGPTPCQTRMPAASRRSSSASLSGCWLRVALAPIAFSRATIASMSEVAQRVAAAGRVLLQRGAVQAQRLAVEQQRARPPAHSRRPTRAPKRRLAGTSSSASFSAGMARLPQVGVADRARCAHRGLRARAEAARSEAAARSRPASRAPVRRARPRGW
jgi:hypothetical protein